MPETRILQRSFIGGEISPEFLGRVGDNRFGSSVLRARNMVIKPTGIATRRPRLTYVATSKNTTDKIRLLPWRASTTDTMVIGVSPGYFRFYTEGQVMLRATARVISGIDTSDDRIAFSQDHNFAINDPIRFQNSIGFSLPGPLTDTATYYVKSLPVIDPARQITISATPGGATINITTFGSGTSVAVDAADVPAEYINSEVISSVDFGAANEFTTATNHDFTTGDPVNLTSSTNDLPADLEEGVTYYAINTGVNKVKVALTAALATAGTAYNITDAGSGTLQIHYAYQQGDLVHTTGYGVFYVNQPYPNGNPLAFSLEPLTGEYEVPNGYVESNLPQLNTSQVNDRLTIAHPDHRLGELYRRDVNTWVWEQSADGYGAGIETPVIFGGITRAFGEYWNATCPNGSPLFTTSGARTTLGEGEAVLIETSAGSGVAPSGFTTDIKLIDAAPTPTTFTLRSSTGNTLSNTSGSLATAVVRRVSLSSDIDETYVATAVTAAGEETVASAAVTAADNPLYVSGSSNSGIVFPYVDDAARYRFYKLQNGLYGLIAETEAPAFPSFKDDNIAPDLSFTPPLLDDSFETENPAVVGYFERRRVFGKEDSQELWFTRTNSNRCLTYHLPLLDTDRINFELAAVEACSVKHVVPLGVLVVLTDSTEFVVFPADTEALTPTSFRVRPVSYVGASFVKPITSNSTVLFAASRGGHVHEFSRTSETGYQAPDVSIRATHLFDGTSILESAYSRAPFPVAWFVNERGLLLGMTYVPEEDIYAWHWHDTEGTFESIAAVPEGAEDALYVVVLRGNGSGAIRTIERMGSFEDAATAASLTDAGSLDCCQRSFSSAAYVVDGLGRFEGEEITLFLNTGTYTKQTVSSGTIYTALPSSAVLLGYAFTSELRTLPVAFQIDSAFGQGRTKNINRCWLRVANSTRFDVGPYDPDEGDAGADFSTTTELTVGTRLSTEVDVTIPGDWTDGGQVWVRQTAPNPLTVISLCAEVSIGS